VQRKDILNIERWKGFVNISKGKASSTLQRARLHHHFKGADFLNIPRGRLHEHFKGGRLLEFCEGEASCFAEWKNL